jgi:malonyl-CoA O-methyltransferase
MLLDKAKIRHAFAAACATYDRAAHLQRTVGAALLQAGGVAGQGGTLLDIGCGTGFLTGELLARTTAQHIIALDMALPMLHATRQKCAAGVGYVCADAEALPLADESIDGVFSNLALQWCTRLDTVFGDIRRVLKPDGRLLFSTFGADTLHELKTAWASVDDYRHVNDFYDEKYIVESLQRAGFSAINSHRQIYTPRYGSVLALMHELKHLGAHHVQAGRNQHFTSKTALQRMVAAYPSVPAITATFDVLTVSATR